MNTSLKLSILAILSLNGMAHAEPTVKSTLPQAEASGSSGITRMKSIIDSVTKNDKSAVDATTQRSIDAGMKSATVSADTSHMDPKTVNFAVQQTKKWDQLAREAYVAALPPRDRALGASVLLGDGASGPGRMYIFVSRSMPQSLLRAYAVDAFYLGAQLVVKGVRKGDTLKEYIMEAMEDFNSTDGMMMASMEINPNLFDMFDVKMVPAVVWTNRVGLDDIGSGCQNPDAAQVEKLSLPGPNDQPITVDKPVCAKLPQTAYYKLTGALAMPYVLDRFQEAGLPKASADAFRALLAVRSNNVHDGSVRQELGHAMPQLSTEVKLDRLPKNVLLGLQEELASGNVQRGVFGPTFSPDADDDVEYRKELTDKIRHQLAL